MLESWTHGIIESWNLGIMESWNLEILESWTQEAPKRHPGDTQGAPRGHPGDTQGAPRRHPGGTQRHPGGTWKARGNLEAKVRDPAFRVVNLRVTLTKSHACASQDAAEPSATAGVNHGFLTI